MSHDEQPVFTGTEDIEDESTAVAPSLPGGDLTGLLEQISRNQWIAFMLGFGPMFLGLALMPIREDLATTALGIGFGYFLIAARVDSCPRDSKLKLLCKEPKFAIGGLVLGTLVGGLVLGVVVVLARLIRLGAGIL